MNKIRTLEDLKREFAPTVNFIEFRKSHMSKTEKAALFITKHVGTMPFFYLCVILVVTPFVYPNTLPIVQYISAGFLQLLLLPLIMIGQNLQARHAELRALHDYETNVKAEKEIESILLHLERQDELMLEILKRIEKLERSKK